MCASKIDLGVSDKQLGDEYLSGISIYKLAKKYKCRQGMIKSRIVKRNITLYPLSTFKLWTVAEDNILILLRNCGYNLQEISEGILERSKKGVMARIVILKRDRKVI